ncbi:MAG: hypothetical protein PWP31_301 [Clostridia bacterium]|nr:hypothetical protein [Clostridia bacterium]
MNWKVILFLVGWLTVGIFVTSVNSLGGHGGGHGSGHGEGNRETASISAVV